ncbi:tautomerase family protein [Burkholderia sp. FERM BP-3421]|jgi:4-oxalocrotonate tautomerase|uniref:tautomerase family protein n=1 Tax=Burkholderia sp. FERM BP-3421 TaxID=1494466 RepID=UPI002361AB31|nr:tautomerase family protein [Burkholderia sp. FERM BP-3421]WDD92862.1 tautomerase family protein [Burkholderia sp. FERM BP-3421]
MPFTRIALREGKPAAYRRALSAGIQQALTRVFNVPDDDLFMAVTEHRDDNFLYDRQYLGIARSDDLVMIQITVTDSRGPEQKRALYRQIVEALAASPGVRPEDVFINLVEVRKENWSFGNGIAQYAPE